ncbi:TldD/PmbA family protein [candidate division KSB1 bacterium]
MITKDETRSLFYRVLSLIPDGDAIISLNDTYYTMTRFGNNSITQNLEQNTANVNISIYINKKRGAASTSQFDDVSLKKAVDRAMQMLKYANEDPDFLPPLPQQQYEEVNSYFDSTANFSAEERARGVSYIVNECKKRDISAAGIFTTTAGCSAMMNTAGMFNYRKSTKAEYSATVLTEDSSGWVTKPAWDINEIDPQELGLKAVETAQRALHPKEASPGKYTVILPAYALGYMLNSFNPPDTEDLDENRGVYMDKKDDQIFGSNITIFRDPYHPLMRGAPYDAQGIPMKKLCLIKNGRIGEPLVSRVYAGKKGLIPTGIGSDNRVMEGGNDSIDSMIKATEKGILLTRVWYLRGTDRTKMAYTGMTREGTFLVENGAIKHGIRNFRFNENLFNVLNNIDMMGKPELTGGVEVRDQVLPPVRVNDFYFSSVTKF